MTQLKAMLSTLMAEHKAVEPEQAKKKAGRPKMTPEQKASKAEQKAAKAEHKAAEAEQKPVEVEQKAVEPEQPKKKAGRPKMTPEQKAAKAEQKAAKLAAAADVSSAKAESDNESLRSCSDLPGEWGEMLSPNTVDLSFYPFTYEGQSFLMNDRGDVIEPVEGIWIGCLRNGILDKSATEPIDLQEPILRE